MLPCKSQIKYSIRLSGCSKIKVKSIKKRFNILLVLILTLSTLFGAAYLTFRSPKVQTFVTQWIMVQLSHTYKANITVGGVDISLFKSIVLEKVLIEDRNQDTMFYIGSVRLQIDSLALLERRVHFGDLNFEDSKINIRKDTTGYNFQFLAGSSTSKPDTIRPWHITFTNFYFLNSKINYKNIDAKDTLVNGMNFNDLAITKVLSVEYESTTNTSLAIVSTLLIQRSICNSSL